MLTSRFNVTLFLAAVLLSSAVYAHVARYELFFNGSVISFQLTGSRVVDEGASLSITGPDDFSFSQTFQRLQSIEFDTAGLSDGQYNFEVQALTRATDRNGPTPIGNQVKVATTQRSGVFTINAGLLATTDQEENINRGGALVVTDQIVQGSQCVGQDCVPGESFGLIRCV